MLTPALIRGSNSGAMKRRINEVLRAKLLIPQSPASFHWAAQADQPGNQNLSQVPAQLARRNRATARAAATLDPVARADSPGTGCDTTHTQGA